MRKAIIVLASLALVVGLYADGGGSGLKTFENDPSIIAGIALTRDTTFTGGNITGKWCNLTVSTLPAGIVGPAAIDPTVVTNVLAAKMTLPAVSGEAITNLAGGNIYSGDIAAPRIFVALSTSGTNIGGNILKTCLTNAMQTIGTNIGGNIPIAALTNANHVLLNTEAATVLPSVVSNPAPTYIGQHLIYTMSNLVFVAKGVTTNSWISINGAP